MCLLAGLCVANLAAAQNDSELRGAFDAYNAAAKAGNVDKMLSLRTAASQQEIRSQLHKKEDREMFLWLGRAQTPESYQVEHVSWSKAGNSADLYLMGQFPAMPEAKRPRGRMEVMVKYKKEGGHWKIDSTLPLGDPDKVKRPTDLTYDPKDAKMTATASIGGRIVKTEFKPDYTLVLLRVMDEEDAVFLPPQSALAKAGLSPKDLAPWHLYEFSGHPHQRDKLKFFATGGKPIEE